MGSPIAGILKSTAGAQQAQTLAPYRIAIFYAGDVALKNGHQAYGIAVKARHFELSDKSQASSKKPSMYSGTSDKILLFYTTGRVYSFKEFRLLYTWMISRLRFAFFLCSLCCQFRDLVRELRVAY